MSVQNEKNVFPNENSVEGKPCINRESKSLEILYSCYDMLLFVLSLQAVGMPELWGGVGLNRYADLTWFQPRTVANPALDSGCPTRIL